VLAENSTAAQNLAPNIRDREVMLETPFVAEGLLFQDAFIGAGSAMVHAG